MVDDIINNIKSGSKEESDKAFALLYNKYKNFVYDFGRTMGIPKNLCYDFLQETFIRVFEKINKFKEGKEFFPWFFSLVRNECINFMKRNRKHITSNSNIPNYTQTIKEKLSLDDVSIINEIRNLLPSLPYEEKEVIFLKYYQGFETKEIAKLLNISERKVFMLINKALEKIKKHLGIS